MDSKMRDLLVKQRDVLVERLNRGWDMIDETIKNKLDPTAFEDHWIVLLEQYCDVEETLRG